MDSVIHRDTGRVGRRRDAAQYVAAGPPAAHDGDSGPYFPDAEPTRVRHARASGVPGDKGLSFANRYLCRDGNRNTAKESAIRSHSMRDTVPPSGVPRSADAVVIGGGCMGASIAWDPARRGMGGVVLGRDNLAAGGTGPSGARGPQHHDGRIRIRPAPGGP